MTERKHGPCRGGCQKEFWDQSKTNRSSFLMARSSVPRAVKTKDGGSILKSRGTWAEPGPWLDRSTMGRISRRFNPAFCNIKMAGFRRWEGRDKAKCSRFGLRIRDKAGE